MKYRALPPVEILKELFEYHPESGILRWKARDKNAGTVDRNGYIHVSVNKQQCYAHRLIYKYMTGRDPADEVDHINGDKSDNRWANIRGASSRQNGGNQRRKKDNKSGVKNVYTFRNKTNVYWCAIWKVEGKAKRKYFPYTETGLEAAAEFMRVKRRELYGEFANDGEHRNASV